MLKEVDFIRPTGELIPGLVPVRDREVLKSLSIDEQAVIFEARSFKRIDYVFFRRFSDSRSSQVAAYVVDNSDGRLDADCLSRLHHQVWLQGTAPLLYVSGHSQIDILACARGPDFWDKSKQQHQYKPASVFKKDLLTTAGQISDELKRFSALRLADGTFWDDPVNRNLVNHDKAAHQSLIEAVVETDTELEGENNPILRRLLLLMVLVKYLEDRGVFPTGWFGRFHKGATNFFEVLQGGDTIEVNKLLASLERKFNGDVFDLSRLDTRGLTKATLTQFAGLVEARTLRRQRYLWQQFSFEHLPVEIISHLYQRFVEDGHGAVYTPHFLASLLLDHVMPYKHLTGKERILDPACGSAVFLVGAFRRLVNFWRSQHNWERPTVETLKNLLRNSIYGIDLDSSAIDLSAFSLSLAICDALKPNVIWNQLKYDRLRDSNLFEKDFFDLLLDSRKGIRNCLQNKFDIVIGNPPFESELTHSAKQVDRIAQKSESSRGNCPDNNLAYLFLEQALTLVCAQNGQVCLIQPSGLLYNSNTNKFRINLFQKCQTHTIFDFTSIRKLYDAADPKTIALSASNLNPAPDHCINHWTFRRTVSAKEKMCFELDHYDCHKVTLEQAKSNPHIWRADLLGGGRLVDLSMQFQSMRTVAEYIASKKGWDYGEGYIAAKTGKREPASFLTGKRLLPAKALTQSGIDESQIGEVKETSFRSPYTENRYSSPLILIRKVESLPMVFLDKGFLAYRNEIVGIHAPEPSRTELQHLYDVFCDKHDILKFVITLHGARSFVSKSTSVFKSDVDQLPFPEKSSSFKLSFWEQALKDDVLNYMSDYVRLGQNSQLLRKAAGKKEVCGYSNMFIRMLGSIYGNLKAGDPIFFNKLICQPFYFGDSAKLEWISRSAESQLTRLVYYKKHDHLRTVRVVRFYDKNVILIVKPDRLRYWIRSTAIRDADETLVDLYNQGY